MAVSAEWQVGNEISRKLMRRVEVRRGAELVRVPCIDDLPTKAGDRANTLRIRRQVDRLRVCVVEVKLYAMSHGMFQRDLHRVVTRGAHRAPAIQRRILRVVEGELATRRQVGLSRIVCVWNAEVIQIEKTRRFVQVRSTEKVKGCEDRVCRSRRTRTTTSRRAQTELTGYLHVECVE